MDTAIYQLITSQGPITSIIEDRLSPVIRPQGSGLPAITYRKVSSPREYNDSGQISLSNQWFDLFIYAKTYGQMQNLQQVVEENLKEKSGTFGSKKISYVEITEVGEDDYLEDSQIHVGRIEIKITFS